MSAATKTRQLPERVLVGRVRKPHGVRGEVSVEPLSDVAERFAPGSELSALLPDGSRLALAVATARPHGDVRLVRFEGYEGRDAAEELRGAALEVDRALVPPRPDGSFYYWELVGCRCVDRRAGELGEVVTLVEDGGGVLLEIHGPAGRVLIPFVRAYLVRVDVESGVIETDLPPGLVETCTSTS